MKQIALIRPKIVCSLGNWATQTLLERKVGITRVRGQVFYLKDFVLFPLLHPAAALHQAAMLPPLREDFQKLKAFLDRHSTPAEPEAAAPSGTARTVQIEPPAAAAQQLDLFGS